MTEIRRTDRGLEVSVPPFLRGMSAREYFTTIESQMRESPGDLYFDCSAATLIDSTALGKIIFMAKELHRENRRVVFESCPPSIREILTKLKADQFIHFS